MGRLGSLDKWWTVCGQFEPGEASCGSMALWKNWLNLWLN